MARGNIASYCRSIIGYPFHYTNRFSHSQKFPKSFFSNPISGLAIEKKIKKNGCDFQGDRGLGPYFSTWWNMRRGFAQCSILQQGTPPPPPPSEAPPNTSWVRWTMGIIMTVILPFFGRKWAQFLLVKKEVDTVVEAADEIIDAVEVVAEKVEKMAEDIADDCPGGKIRNAANFVEDVAERVAKDAHMAEEFLDKVEEIEEKMEEIVKPARRHKG